MKKLVVVLMSVLLVFSLAACGDGGNGGNGGAVKGETVDTTVFSVLVPDGWKSFNTSDIFDEYTDLGYDPNGLNIYKGAESDWDMFTCPGLNISYFGPDTTMLAPDKAWYEGAEDLESFTTGAYTWQGFTYTIGDYGMGVIWTDSPIQLTVSIVLSSSNGSISIDDADVQAILASIAVDAQ